MEPKKKVLVVEDNPGDARLLQETFKTLTDGEFELVHESSTGEAIRHLSHEKIDFILLDLFLPDTSGLETVEKVLMAKTGIPVIVMTGHYDEAMAAQALERGADFFVSKDRSDMKALVRALRDCVNSANGGLNGKAGETVKKKVLVVEDNPGDARLLLEAFKKKTDGEFELIHEICLRDALQRLSREKMDFILLDLVLPDASGLETIGKINEVDSKTPLVVLTGFYDETLKAQALEKGANFFVSKDRSDVNALVKALRDYVEFQRMGI